MSGWLTEAMAGVGAGLVVGLGFFGGLVATTRRLTRRSASSLLLALSLTTRLAVLGAVLVLLARWSPVALLAAASGLVAVRLSMTQSAALDRWFGVAAPGETTVRSRHG